MKATVASLVVLAAAAAAFRHTVPLIAASSDPTCPLRDAQAHAAASSWEDVVSMLPLDDLCCHKTILLLEHTGLHASDLQLLPRSSDILASLLSSSSLLQVPRLKLPSASVLDAWIHNVSSSCGHVLHHTTTSLDAAAFRPDTKYLIRRSPPALPDNDIIPLTETSGDLSSLSDQWRELSRLFPSHLIVLLGVPAETWRRELDELAAPPPPFFDSVQRAATGTLSNSPFLSRYQLFTPGLISSLLVVFIVFLPILLVGVSSLASIQSPIKMDVPKGPSAEKKHQ